MIKLYLIGYMMSFGYAIYFKDHSQRDRILWALGSWITVGFMMATLTYWFCQAAKKYVEQEEENV